VSALLTDISPALSPLRTHPLQDVAAGQTISVANKAEKLFAPGTTPPPSLRLHAAATTRLADLRSLVRLDGLELAIYRSKPIIELAFLVRKFLTLATEPFMLTSNIIRKAVVQHFRDRLPVRHRR
jgi:hypothetical protein